MCEHGRTRRPKERHQLRRQAARAAEREGPLRDAFERLAGPERERIRAELPAAKELLDELEGRHYGHLHFTLAHPEAFRRLELLDHEIATAAWAMDLERQDLDGIPALRPEPLQRGRELQREVAGLDLGIEL